MARGESGKDGTRAWSPCRSARGGIAFAVFAAVFACATVQAATPPSCGRVEPAAMSDPTECRRRFDDATPAALLAEAETRTRAGDFDVAEAALGCAAAGLGEPTDDALRYDWVRRRGVLAYRRERIPEALSRFECALQWSQARGDRIAAARDLRNIGTALRRLGDYPGALRALTRSLELQRAHGTVDGAALNNIADVYRDLREPAEAMRFYREALAAMRARGEPSEAAHVLESMAELALDTDDPAQALRWQAQALQAFREGGNRAYELRVHGGMARAALALEDLPAARRHVAAATALASAHRLPLPSSLQLQAARVERRSGELAAAAARLDAALAEAPAGDLDRPALLQELAAVQEARGDRAAAIETLRRAHAEGLAQDRARHDRELGWQRTRFETAERDRRIAALEADNRLRGAALRQRTLVLGLIAALAIAVALAVWLYQQRQRQRERLREEAHRVRQEQRLAHWRREADALAEDRGLLQALFDSREDAVCLLDAEGHVLAANRAACAALGAEPAQGQALVDALAEADRDALAAALERMEDSAAQTLRLHARDARALEARLSQWPHGDGLLLLRLQAPDDVRDAGARAPDANAADAAGPAAVGSTVVDGTQVDPAAVGMREGFRRALVELMLAVVENWERSTGSSRLELAEKSRVWRVTVDDGRLRARAMERYLSLSKLPTNPRWRDVLRSAYFVLGHCPLEPAARETLQARLDAVLAYTRRSALV